MSPKKWHRCVSKVKASNRGKSKSKRVNPYAVCTKSTGQTRTGKRRSKK